MAQHNDFIDGIGLTETNSLIHLLDSNDNDDNDEAPIIKHSAYFGENEFSTMLASKAGLSILSGNIQSINAKFDEFQSFVTRVNTSHPISAICLQECWLDEKDTESIGLFNLSDYTMVHQTKRCCGHGGLITYIHNKFKYTLVDTIKQRATGWEYQCIELSHHEPHSQKYLLCNVYRKPGEILDDFNLFLEEFGSFIRLVKNINRSSYICGDYNIDLLKIKTNKHFNEFFDNLITTGFFPKITLPTRFTEQSSTLIDNVFSNNIEERETSGILLNHISDHQLLFTYIEKLSYIERVPKYIDVEKADTISIAKFVKELNDGNIYDQLLKPIDSNPHENYDTFMKIIQQAKDTHLPRKTVKFKKKKHKKSKWMTYGILNSINKKDKLYKLILKSDVNSNSHADLKARFKRYRETLRSIIKEAKRLYYHRTFLLYQNNVRKTWSVIKETLQRKKRHEMPGEFVWNNRVITDMTDIANEFNRYFISIGHTLSEQIQSVHSCEEYLGHKADSVFKFSEVNEDCIDKIIKNLKSKSSTGYDNISNKLIKHARAILVKPLTLLTNQIIHTGVFPRQLKVARVKPLFKKGDQSNFSNYRPISLLPSISKIFEQVMAA